jgi:hypothetical protein
VTILDRILVKINSWINPPNQIYSICIGCGRKFRYFRKRGLHPAFCTFSCQEHERWAKESK